MDRPEWAAVHPATQDVYVSLTNNDRRGADGQPGPDAATTKFRWDVFNLAGEDKGFGSPDGLRFDPRGVL